MSSSTEARRLQTGTEPPTNLRTEPTKTTASAVQGPDPEVGERLERIWKRAYAARTRDDLRELYSDWARTYDEDHEAVGFFGHRRASQVLARYVPFADVAPVLDAGAGTGAAGVELARLGFGNLTALDMSADMLARAEEKGVYRHAVTSDLGLPLDTFPMNHFDAAILVGVFSFGQAPAHALDEIVRVVKPGGVVVFTMRTDFFESDAMGVRSQIAALESNLAWQVAEVTEPELYLPKKDASAKFRVWCYRILATKIPDPPDNLADAVRTAMASPSRIKRIDHCYIWNSMASRLYNRYIECPDYYLPDSEEEILRTHAAEIAGDEDLVVELGCGSARKVRHVLRAALSGRAAGRTATYLPIDLSKGALASTKSEIRELFGEQIRVDARLGHFDDVLPTIPEDAAKVVFFFGGSIGNIETLGATVGFLESLRAQMGRRDRFVVGMDLDKDEAVLVRAYEAGPPNRSFFLNLLRRINNELGANFDLTLFRQESTYDRLAPYHGIEDLSVNLKLATNQPQEVFISKLDLAVHLDAGDSVQVGTSRKFRPGDIEALFRLAGLRLTRQWLDTKGYYSLNECVRTDSAA
jgi:uncharacterized SAM-dependent methyltransferase/ubiquinone/menaquinone biosynthesis C-methylase UbiE